MGIGGAVIGLILLFVLVSGPSYQLGPATTAGIGEQAVVEQASGGSVEVGGEVFYQQGRFAAVGRVFAAGDENGKRRITIVFGDQARNTGVRLISRGNESAFKMALVISSPPRRHKSLSSMTVAISPVILRLVPSLLSPDNGARSKAA